MKRLSLAGTDRARCCCAAALAALMLLAGCAQDREALPAVLPADVPAASGARVPDAEERRVRAAYIPADSLNPYLLSSQVNRDLTTLLYDSLVRLSPDYQPRLDLAESVEMSGNVCKVRLRPDVRFSDGAALTAQDVVYSLGLAKMKDAGKRYGNLVSYAAADTRTLIITFGWPDIYYQNLLTFPIIRDETGAQMVPPGTGRYRYAQGAGLVRNDAHYTEKPGIESVELVPLESAQEIGYRLMSGQLDVARLEPDTSPMETAGSFPVQTNHLIYIGFNTLMAPTDSDAFRRAIEKLCDRGALVLEGCGGRATATTVPIQAALYTADPPADVPLPDVEGAQALLDQTDLKETSPEGWRMRGGSEIELQLCYNVESPSKREMAALLKKQIEAGGVRVALNEYSFDQYKEQVASGGYHLYLGETKLPEDMNLTAFLAQSGSLHYDLGDTSALYESYQQARRVGAEKTYGSFLEEFSQQCPLIPLAFDQSVVAHARNFYSTVVATEQDIFYNIHKW